MRNKLLALILIISIVGSLASVGCSKPEEPSGGEPSTPAGKAVELEVGGSGSGTYIYSFMVAAGEIVNKYSGGKIFLNVQTTSGSNANYPLLGSGEIQIGTGVSTYDMLAYKGEEPFTEIYPTVRSLLSASFILGHFLVPADSSVKTLSDFDGLKVGVGQKGSPTSTMMAGVFERLGIKVELVYSTASEMVELYKDSRVDAIAYIAGAPNSNFLDMISARKGRFIGFSESELEKLSDLYSVKYLTKDMYPNITEDVPTVCSISSVFVSSEVPDDVVYDILDNIFSHWDEISEALPAAATMSPKDVKELRAPLHPGALKYYTDKNIDIADNLK